MENNIYGLAPSFQTGVVFLRPPPRRGNARGRAIAVNNKQTNRLFVKKQKPCRATLGAEPKLFYPKVDF